MKLIYAQGFSKNEKLEWKPVVFNNIVQSFQLIFEAMQELNIEFEVKENEVSQSSCEVQIPNSGQPLLPLSPNWRDCGVQLVIAIG